MSLFVVCCLTQQLPTPGYAHDIFAVSKGKNVVTLRFHVGPKFP